MKRLLFFLFILPVFCFSVSAVDVMTDVLDLSDSSYNKFGTPPSPANGSFSLDTIDISTFNLTDVPVFQRDLGNTFVGDAAYYLEFNYDLSDVTSFGLISADSGLPSSLFVLDATTTEPVWIPCSGCEVADTGGNVLREYSGSGPYSIDFDLPSTGEVVLLFRFLGSYSIPNAPIGFIGFPRYMTLQTTYDSEPDAPVIPGPEDPPGSVGSLMSDLSSVASSALSVVSSVCSSIVNQPFLLLCAGFLLLGGGVGILGRLLRRD